MHCMTGDYYITIIQTYWGKAEENEKSKPSFYYSALYWIQVIAGVAGNTANKIVGMIQVFA